MPSVLIYTKPWCPYCQAAKALLKGKGVAFEEIDVSDAREQARMAERAGRSTVPQVFIGERHVGGSDDLHALDARGELDRLLKG